MYFFLGTHCGGRRCALPAAPPHPLLFFNRLPLLPTLFHFFHRYRFFGVIFSLVIFIYIHRDLSLCASFLVRIAGGGAAPLFLFEANTYPGTCMSIEHIYMRPSRLKRYIESNPVDTARTGNMPRVKV